MKKLKITLLIDQVLKGYKGLSHSYLEAFEKNNYECGIISFHVDPIMYKSTRYFSWVHHKYLAYKQKEVLEAIKRVDSDLIFVIKGFYMLPETIDKIKGLNKTVICFHPDDPFSSFAGASTVNLRNCINHYDIYFIWYKQLISKLKEAGCKSVYYLPFAADTNLFKPPNNHINNEQKKYAVSFVGNANQERIEFIQSLTVLLNGWNESKALFGHGWKNIEGFECKGTVYNNDFVDLIHNTKVNLNILRNQNKGSHNMRTFDIPAAGGFILHEFSDEAACFFEEGIEVEFYRDVEECADKIKFYSENDELRNKIAQAGYKKIFSAGYAYTDLVNIITEKSQEKLAS